MRRGFTLIELLVVIAIFAMLLTLGGVVLGVTRSHRLGSAASIVQSGLAHARDRAALAARQDARSEYAGRTVAGFAGLRITHDRVIPLRSGSVYAEGAVSVRMDQPDGFAPPTRRLVLEEAKYDAGGRRNNPTSWYYNVRLGDVVRVAERDYIVCGPIVDPNAEGYVNVGPPGAPSTLDRGDGPIEYLLLVNGSDDNRNGLVDDGWNGLDDDLDGYADEDDEWEVERWRGVAATGLISTSYSIHRRPSPDPTGSAELPSGVVVDFDGSTFWGRAAIGPVDLVMDQFGAIRPMSRYATTQTPINGDSLTIRLMEAADPTSAVVLTVDATSGRSGVTR